MVQPEMSFNFTLSTLIQNVYSNISMPATVCLKFSFDLSYQYNLGKITI